MKKQFLFYILFGLSLFINAQVGIETDVPNSTLDVNGSVAVGYRQSSATTYTLTIDDHYYVYTGTSSATLNLPDPVTGSDNQSVVGRLYRIKNGSNYNLTLLPSGNGVTLRVNNELNRANVVIQPGDYVEVIRTTNATQNAWDLNYIAKTLENDDSSLFVYGAKLTVPPLRSAQSSWPADWNYSTASNIETSINNAYTSGSGTDRWVLIRTQRDVVNNPNPGSSSGSNLSGTFRINRASGNRGYFVTNIEPSKIVLTYEYQGTPFENLDRVYPIATAGNDQRYPDVFHVSFEKLENVETNGRGRRTRLTVIVSRVDLMGIKTNDANNKSDWMGTFFFNLLLANKF